MLITAKSLMDEVRERFPGYVLNFRLDRLKPASYGMGEMMSGHVNPDRWMNRVHFKMGTSTGQPQLRIIPIELRKQHLRELA